EPDDSLAGFSNFGLGVALAAPGDNIWTTDRDLTNPYGSWRGTSFASPVVAGVAGLVAAANPFLSNSQIVSLLETNADDVGSAGYDTTFGFGRVNAFRAIAAASGVPGAQSNPGSNSTQFSIQLDPPSTNTLTPIGPLPVSSAAGNYTGLVAAKNGVAIQTSGYLVLTVRPSGAFTGRLVVNSQRHGFHGWFNDAGDVTLTLQRGTNAPITLELQLDLMFGTDDVYGTVRSQSWSSALVAGRNVFNARRNPAQQAGLRQFVLERGPFSAGSASSTLLTSQTNVATGSTRISPGGHAAVHGTLADDRPFATGSTLDKHGNFPFYLSFHHGTELLIGWLNFPSVQQPLCSGNVIWLNSGTNAFAASLSVQSVQ
ncbi:MAG TPA: S8 family serine peptidase, partial [Candidatus Dormibacteraeota bacterium]|nr:S8 family serine peptidase [Candidatus Dormibacteraeota bacterium]